MEELYKVPYVTDDGKDDGWFWFKPRGSEQHSADWSAFIAPVSGGWKVVFLDEILDTCRTREEARTRIREYKRNPALAVAAAILSL